MHFEVMLTPFFFFLAYWGEWGEESQAVPAARPEQHLPKRGCWGRQAGKGSRGQGCVIACKSPQELNCRWELLNLIWCDTDLPV